jgi:hypothetical protein
VADADRIAIVSQTTPCWSVDLVLVVEAWYRFWQWPIALRTRKWVVEWIWPRGFWLVWRVARVGGLASSWRWLVCRGSSFAVGVALIGTLLANPWCKFLEYGDLEERAEVVQPALWYEEILQLLGCVFVGCVLGDGERYAGRWEVVVGGNVKVCRFVVANGETIDDWFAA